MIVHLFLEKNMDMLRKRRKLTTMDFIKHRHIPRNETASHSCHVKRKLK